MTVFLPPEWAPQSAIQLTWPRASGDFAHWFTAVRDNFLRLAVAISRYQDVLIGTEEALDTLRVDLVAAGAVASRLHLYPVRSNDVWARDHGPITVMKDGRLAHLDIIFNGWGGKFDAALDNTLTQQQIGRAHV
jgi:agmatine/peptidylarginine deiminase